MGNSTEENGHNPPLKDYQADRIRLRWRAYMKEFGLRGNELQAIAFVAVRLQAAGEIPGFYDDRSTEAQKGHFKRRGLVTKCDGDLRNNPDWIALGVAEHTKEVFDAVLAAYIETVKQENGELYHDGDFTDARVVADVGRIGYAVSPEQARHMRCLLGFGTQAEIRAAGYNPNKHEDGTMVRLPVKEPKAQQNVIVIPTSETKFQKQVQGDIAALSQLDERMQRLEAELGINAEPLDFRSYCLKGEDINVASDLSKHSAFMDKSLRKLKNRMSNAEAKQEYLRQSQQANSMN